MGLWSCRLTEPALLMETQVDTRIKNEREIESIYGGWFKGIGSFSLKASVGGGGVSI